MKTNRHQPTHVWPLLGIILLIALALRLALWAQPLHLPANDEVEYVRVATDLLEGRGWSFYSEYRWLRAPLYSLFLAGSLWLAGGDLHLAALPNLGLSVLLVGLIFALTRELAPQRRTTPALIAAGAAALLFTYATFASLYMSETLFAVLFTASLLILLRWARAGAQGWIRPIGAGLLFGLACLTRSAPLTFAPFVMLWMIWMVIERRPVAGGWRALRQPQVYIPALLFALLVTLTIAPWTLRNCRAYSACILIETGLSYNLWAFSEPRESFDTIHQTLEAILDPVERAAFASERGMERLREDPAIMLRKLPSNWIITWTIKPIQDRFLLADYRADPPPVVFLGSLLFDDLLYLLALSMALPGLAAMVLRRHRGALLVLLWPPMFVATALITHGETRYRHFFWMLLLAYAAIGLDLWRRGELRLPRPLAVGTLALWVTLMIPLLGWYPWQWASDGAMRSVYRQIGDLRVAIGDLPGAQAAYFAALRADPTADGWITLGDVARRQGDLATAEAAYRAARDAAQGYPAGWVRLGDLLRQQGRTNEARDAFLGQFVDAQQITDWAYRSLNTLPAQRIDSGNLLDNGYLGGVFPPELIDGGDMRWTRSTAEVRLAMPTTGTVVVRLRAAAPRPDGIPVVVRICTAAACARITLGSEMRIVQVVLPAAPGLLTLHSPTFRAGDGRALGMMLDWIEINR